MLYPQNIFSFGMPEHLCDFLYMLTPVQKKALAKLHFSHKSPCYWKGMIEVKALESLTGLKELHISIDYHIRRAILPEWKTNVHWRERRLRAFLRWRILPLRTVTVVFMDNARRKPLLTRKEESDIAEELWGKLLDPAGREYLLPEREKDEERFCKEKEYMERIDSRAKRQNTSRYDSVEQQLLWGCCDEFPSPPPSPLLIDYDSEASRVAGHALGNVSDDSVSDETISSFPDDDPWEEPDDSTTGFSDDYLDDDLVPLNELSDDYLGERLDEHSEEDSTLYSEEDSDEDSDEDESKYRDEIAPYQREWQLPGYSPHE